VVQRWLKGYIGVPLPLCIAFRKWAQEPFFYKVMVFAAALPSTTPKSVGSSLFFLVIYGQNDILKITSAKILCFLRFSIAKIQSNFKEKSPDFYMWLK